MVQGIDDPASAKRPASIRVRIKRAESALDGEIIQEPPPKRVIA